jgi:hypothetical protein
VAMWLKNGHKYIFTPVINVVKYKASWQNWWQGLQPEWHLLDDGTLLQEVPDIGEQWEKLRRGGSNGFFMIVLALSWWAEAMGGKLDNAGLREAVDDITWVVGCMADMPATPGQLVGKCTHEPDTSVKKRYILSFSITS